MSNWKKHLKAATVLSMLLLGMTVAASAQKNSNVSNITMSANLSESVSVSLSGSSVNFTLTSGSASNPGNTTISATTSWVLQPGRTGVKLLAYFDSSTIALAHTDPANTSDIPSSAVELGVNGGALTSVSSTVAFGAANAGLQLFSQSITGTNKNSSRTDTLSFNINLGSLAQLPSDTYNGTLHIQAQATP